jgi:hypothetical protein
MRLKQYLNELKATQVNIDDSFILSADIGEFRKGETVRVMDVKSTGDDVEIKFINNKGIIDIFYLDKNDTFETLN